MGEECGQCEDLLVEVNVNVRLTESGNVICKSLPPSPCPYVSHIAALYGNEVFDLREGVDLSQRLKPI